MSDSRQGGGGGGAARAFDSAIDPANDKPREPGPDPLIGRLVNGRFKVVSVIARGGMGKVYKAEQAPLGRICALKVLNPKYDGDRDPEFHKRFFLEASTAARLTHPNTVTIFDYGQSDDIYYIAMEFIDGKTLHRALREEGPFPEGRAAMIAAQVCRSLREAHTLGVVHRDLKPGNILLTDRGDERDYVKVLDFGLVKDVTGEAEDLTQAGLFMGSPKYMAPEQILGNEISPRTDIYSLGVMIYEMLSGKVPFDRGASVGTLMAHVNEPPPPLQANNPAINVSPLMESVVKKCLEKDPNNRYVSMKALLDALKRVGGDAMMVDTSEGLPAAYVGPSSGPMSGIPPERGSMPSQPSPTYTGSSGNHPAPAFATASISEALNAPPDKTAIVELRKGSKRPLLWVALVALAAAGVFAFLHVQKGGLVAASDPVPPLPTATATAAPTANAPATAATTTAAPAPTVRTVRVDTDPSGASVSENGVEICSATPCEVMFKGDGVSAEHTLKLTKKGFKPGKVTVLVSDEKTSAKLDSASAGPARGGPKQPADYKPSPY
jgi:serine/threonine-protein kinase